MSKDDDDDAVDLPVLKRVERFFCDIFGWPFIYTDFKYDRRAEMVVVVFDYNNPMLNRVREGGFDDDDPDDAIRHYIQRVMITNHDAYDNIEPAEDTSDPDYDDDAAGTYVHKRGNN